MAVLALIGAVDCARLHREPLAAWKPIPAKEGPKNYFVPNFGADPDMYGTINSITSAEVSTGEKFLSDK